MSFISSEPHALMRAYEVVAAREGFAQLAPSHQFDLLVEAIAKDYRRRRRQCASGTLRRSARRCRCSRTWSTARRPREVELWRVAKDGRQLRCVAVYVTTGIDLRLMEGEDFRRTQLLCDGPAVEATAEEWHRKAAERGWS